MMLPVDLSGALHLAPAPGASLASLYYSHTDTFPVGVDDGSSFQPHHGLSEASHTGQQGHTLEISGADGDHAHAVCSWEWSTNGEGETTMGHASCNWHTSGDADTLAHSEMGSEMHTPQVEELMQEAFLLPQTMQGAQRDPAKRVNPGLGHVSLMGCAAVFGAVSATKSVTDKMSELRNKRDELRSLQQERMALSRASSSASEEDVRHWKCLQKEAALKATIETLQKDNEHLVPLWRSSFQNESCKAAGAVTPLGQYIMSQHLFEELPRKKSLADEAVYTAEMMLCSDECACSSLYESWKGGPQRQSDLKVVV